MGLCSATLKVINEGGLHARPAAKLAECAISFDSEISISKDGNEVDIASVMNILILEVCSGSEITIKADGEDAEQAIKELSNLINSGFSEV